MSQVICSSCFDVGDTTKRFIELPYVCALCEKDSALAIEQDVWEAEYVGPACQQAAEEVHGLYIDDAPYNSGVPCQSALDSVQAEQFDILAGLDVFIPSPVGNLEQAPILIDDVTDSGVAPE